MASRFLGPPLIVLLAVSVHAGPVAGQSAVARILEQESSLNNLVDPPGYEPGPMNELGAVKTVGSGPEAMILIPGLGFGGDVFDPLLAELGSDYSATVVTLAGFGGTPAPPTPPEGTSAGDQTWTEGALQALLRVVDDTEQERVVLVGHWLTGTQLALRVAQQRPERVSAVILLAGSARFVSSSPQMPSLSTVEERVAMVDNFLAPRWFRTVTRETWDDNNFLPSDYAAHPVIGLRLWREAARPPLHVWIRYLIEFNAQDITFEVPEVEAPILLLSPGFEGAYQPPGNRYLDGYTRTSWGDLVDAGSPIRSEIVADTRIVMWAEDPGLIAEHMQRFLTEVHN